MAINTDKNSYTILFATGMVIIVGALLAFVSSNFKEKIIENKRIEKQQNILYAMGVNENDETSVEFVSKNIVGQEFSKYIVKQYVVTGTEAVEDANAYLIDIKKEEAKALIATDPLASTEEEDGADKEALINLKEIDRLHYHILAIENDCHVVPMGSMKLNCKHEVQRSEAFNGFSNVKAF